MRDTHQNLPLYIISSLNYERKWHIQTGGQRYVDFLTFTFDLWTSNYAVQLLGKWHLVALWQQYFDIPRTK